MRSKELAEKSRLIKLDFVLFARFSKSLLAAEGPATLLPMHRLEVSAVKLDYSKVDSRLILEEVLKMNGQPIRGLRSRKWLL